MVASGGIEAMAFARTAVADAKRSSPDLQIHFAPLVVDMEMAKALGVDKDYEKFLMASSNHGCTFLSTLLQPKSRGTITLSSVDPFAAPVIDVRTILILGIPKH
jgi:choline dehydrogenase-like flavoprotein